jgi:hypothetical protein
MRTIAEGLVCRSTAAAQGNRWLCGIHHQSVSVTVNYRDRTFDHERAVIANVHRNLRHV